MLHSRCLVFCASSFNVFRPDQSTEYLEHTKKAHSSPCLSLFPFLTHACFCSVCCVHHVFHLDACHALLADSQSDLGKTRNMSRPRSASSFESVSHRYIVCLSPTQFFLSFVLSRVLSSWAWPGNKPLPWQRSSARVDLLNDRVRSWVPSWLPRPNAGVVCCSVATAKTARIVKQLSLYGHYSTTLQHIVGSEHVPPISKTQQLEMTKKIMIFLCVTFGNI